MCVCVDCNRRICHVIIRCVRACDPPDWFACIRMRRYTPNICICLKSCAGGRTATTTPHTLHGYEGKYYAPLCMACHASRLCWMPCFTRGPDATRRQHTQRHTRPTSKGACLVIYLHTTVSVNNTHPNIYIYNMYTSAQRANRQMRKNNICLRHRPCSDRVFTPRLKL